MKTRTALAAVSLAAALVAPVTSAAAAAPVQCGDTITGSVTLTEDLHCQDTTGLILQPGATLDLGGHTLFGDGDLTEPGGPGITVPDAGNVTVTNGSIRGWTTAIRNTDDGTPDPAPIYLTHLLMQLNDGGVVSVGFNRHGAPPVDMQISDAKFVNNRGAVSVGSGRATVRHSYVTSRAYFSTGVDADGGGVLSVQNTTFQSVSEAMVCRGSQCSLTDSVIRDGKYGVVTQDDQGVKAYPAVISGNRITRVVQGVYVITSLALVTITRNRFLQDTTAVQTLDSFVNMTHNDVRDGTTGLLFYQRSFPYTQFAVVAFNTFAGNHDGVLVAATPRAWAAALRLGSNAAIDNVDYGIYAPGATDRGGNTASGNGHDPQCVGVVCA